MEVQQVLMVFFLAMAILWGHIESESLYSADGIVYALVGKELSRKPLIEWAVLTCNGSLFFEHPHLTPWILGIFMKIFGATTLSALMPIVLISHGTVLLTYFLSRKLLDHRFGMLAATVLSLTPQFLKNGRNPMMEPALMLCIMLTIFFYIHAVSKRQFLHTLLAGFFFGLSFLAKGPPSILALAVIAAFQGLTHRSASVQLTQWRVPWKNFFIQFLIIILTGTTVVLLVDLWYYFITGGSFFAYYISHQLKFTVIEGRGVPTNELWFYLKLFLHYWPWMPLVMLSIPLVFFKKDQTAIPALIIGGLITLGTHLGFTLSKQKSDWYIAIYYVGSSMLAALSLRYLISEKVFQKYYVKSCFSLIIPLLFLSASFPSIFTHYPRPVEQFLEKASSKLHPTWEEKMVSDCIDTDPWKGRFFLKFYLGMDKTTCDDASAQFKIIDNRKNFLNQSKYRILFADHPFSLIERITDAGNG